MRRRKDSISWELALGLILAAALMHVLFAFMVEGMMRLEWKGAPLPASEQVMEISLVPSEEETEELAQREDLERAELVKNQRVVNEAKPDDTRRISEIDQKVERETVAPNQRPIPAAPSRPKGDRPQQQDERSEKDDPERRETKGEAEAGEAEGQRASQDDADLVRKDDGQVQSERGAARPTSPRGLRGTPDQLQGLFGRPGSYDRVPDAEPGDESVLNSRRNKYASFFNRVRDQVAREWEPERAHSRVDPYGKVFGSQTRTTRLRILLNPDGSVHRIYVDQSSGAAHLDEEAIRATRLAAPFINPPPQLIDPRSGKIDFTFNFILMIDGSKRIFRYKR